MKGKFCVVRSYAAGIHFGVVDSIEGKAVTLTDARRLWSWSGARTLHEVALRGVSDTSRISEAVPEILIVEAEEVIPATDAARENLCKSRWG